MATSRIFVKGLPPNITETEFRNHFSANNRHITDVKLIPQRRIGYIGYKSSEDASSAVKYFNRSYIRMSKILVEPARPISDLGLRSSSRPANCPVNNNKAQAIGDKGDVPKKRKRDETDKADSKLHEFLRVMKPGRQGAIADDIGLCALGEAETRENVVSVDDSDDDYHDMPTRPDKSRKIEQTGNGQRVEDAKLQVREAKAPDAASVVAKDRSEDTEPVASQATKPCVAATDDDWLRSRTSRLLDLVDADELVDKTVAQPTGESVIASKEEATHSSTEITSHVADDATGCQEFSEDGAVEAITKTCRLFVRNLPYDVSEDNLQEAFEKYGELQEGQLIPLSI
ncbi:hypothetical protein CDD82_6365 [Ophiocordyceps australis]|uniref:RRM domain-containing protein n=1 Tax=Ophiocordyceps australis TaxID=1399860 RepID=A0A2C5YVE2_9HYPO|nr:hypothetical protein CDD82_6365 [Ophiocordyceps australis]